MTPVNLARIATDANAHHAAAAEAAENALAHAAAAGELLIEAKRALPHGGWLPWLKEHCTFSPRTAQTYMQLAQLPNAQRAAHLSLRKATALLAIPKTELERARGWETEGERLMRDAQERIAAAEARLPEADLAACATIAREMLEIQNTLAAWRIRGERAAGRLIGEDNQQRKETTNE